MRKNSRQDTNKKLIFRCNGESEMFPWVELGSQIFLIYFRELCFTSVFPLHAYRPDVCACSY